MAEHTPDEPIHILLVEDNPGDVRLTQEAFESVDSEIVFHTITDGSETGKYFDIGDVSESDVSPDLVLLDLNLPRVDGFSVLRSLKNELDYPAPPILVLSGSSDESDIAESYDRAANAYLTKPRTPDEYESMARSIESFWLESVQHPPTPS